MSQITSGDIVKHPGKPTVTWVVLADPPSRRGCVTVLRVRHDRSQGYVDAQYREKLAYPSDLTVIDHAAEWEGVVASRTKSRNGSSASASPAVTSFFAVPAHLRAGFQVLMNQLEPENLSADGERSRTAVAAERRRITTAWKELESLVGQRVPEAVVAAGTWGAVRDNAS